MGKIINVKTMDITPIYRFKKLYFRLNNETKVNCFRFFGLLIIMSFMIGLISSIMV